MENPTIKNNGSVNGMSAFKVIDCGKCVGQFTLDLNTKGEFELNNFYINKEFRGFGYGKYVLKMAHKKAIVLNTELVLYVNQVNAKAIAIYLKFGFQFMGEDVLKPVARMLRMALS